MSEKHLYIGGESPDAIKSKLGATATESDGTFLDKTGSFSAPAGGGSTPEEDQWYDIGDLVAEELIFLAAAGLDKTSGNKSFFDIICTVENSGNYIVELYGDNTTLLKSMTRPSGQVIALPLNGDLGVKNTYGYSTFKIRVRAENTNNKITLFSFFNIPGYTLLKALVGCSAITSLASTFSSCKTLRYIEYTATMNSLTSMYKVHFANSSLKSIVFPTNMTSLDTMAEAFSACYALSEITYPEHLDALTTFYQTHANNTALTSVTLPISLLAITTMQYMFMNNFNLETISECVTYNNVQIAMDVVTRSYSLQSFDQPNAKVSKLTINAIDYKSDCIFVDIDYANSTYGGSSPQIDLRYNSLSNTEIDRIFTALPSVTGKTIVVKGNPGAATCTPTIATAKGWTVTVA